MNILDVVFPKVCVGCAREGQYICENCRKKLIVPEPMCPMCCKPSLNGWTHPRCKRVDGMEGLWVGLPYRGLVQDCLKKVKYRRAWEIIEYLYRLCEFPEMEGAITSIPMWREKERERGFNQAEIVAQLLAKNYEIPHRVMLERIRETKPMFGLKKEERRENVEGAFKLMTQYTSVPIQQRVILVDDVWTTGATMRECARVLKKWGAGEVWGMALAR